jgi:hypothetical protein
MREWINAEEQLPKMAGYYLVCDNYLGVVDKAEFNGHSRWNWPFDATHWTPLPEPPREHKEWNGKFL